MTNARVFPFLYLPPELRDQIYSYSVVSPYHIRPKLYHADRSIRSEESCQKALAEPNSFNPALLLVNRQIYREASATLLANNCGIVGDVRHLDVLKAHLEHRKTALLFRIALRRAEIYNCEPQSPQQRLLRERYIARLEDLSLNIYPSMMLRMAWIEIRVDCVGTLESSSAGYCDQLFRLSELASLLKTLWQVIKRDGRDRRKSIIISFPQIHNLDHCKLELLYEELHKTRLAKLFDELALLRTLTVGGGCRLPSTGHGKALEGQSDCGKLPDALKELILRRTVSQYQLLNAICIGISTRSRGDEANSPTIRAVSPPMPFSISLNSIWPNNGFARKC